MYPIDSKAVCPDSLFILCDERFGDTTAFLNREECHELLKELDWLENWGGELPQDLDCDEVEFIAWDDQDGAFYRSEQKHRGRYNWWRVDNDIVAYTDKPAWI